MAREATKFSGEQIKLKNYAGIKWVVGQWKHNDQNFLRANSGAIDDEQEMNLMGKHNNTS
jgi:hypothetical protein